MTPENHICIRASEVFFKTFHTKHKIFNLPSTALYEVKSGLIGSKIGLNYVQTGCKLYLTQKIT